MYHSGSSPEILFVDRTKFHKVNCHSFDPGVDANYSHQLKKAGFSQVLLAWGKGL